MFLKILNMTYIRWMECLAAKFGSKVELIKIGQVIKIELKM